MFIESSIEINIISREAKQDMESEGSQLQRFKEAMQTVYGPFDNLSHGTYLV
jgi:hypothetical protein